MDERASHWQRVYATKGEDEVSWFEDAPTLSMALLEAAGPMARSSVADIGGGASRLVDSLVAAGVAHVTVLDLSAAALDKARARLGAVAAVDWVVSDVTAWAPRRHYDFWHDRAAFHFLTTPGEQAAYAGVLKGALKPRGRAVIATFAPDGPEKCSGLPVARYDAESLAAVLGPGFSLLSTRRHRHVTPWQATQNFQFSVFERLAD